MIEAQGLGAYRSSFGSGQPALGANVIGRLNPHLPSFAGMAARLGPAATFLQIGAGGAYYDDDDRDDPLIGLLERFEQWVGVMVEPRPDEAQRLRQRWSNRDIQVDAVAIDDREGDVDLAFVDPDLARSLGPKSGFLRGCVSIHHAALANLMARATGTDLPFRTITVPCRTLRSVIETHQLQRVDLFVCDAEGHDWTILRQLDLRELGVKVLNVEVHWLAPADRKEMTDWLTDSGYDWKPHNIQLCGADARWLAQTRAPTSLPR